MKVGFEWWFMLGVMNGDRCRGLKVDVMEVYRVKLKDEGSLCLRMKEEEERKKKLVKEGLGTWHGCANIFTGRTNLLEMEGLAKA